jgi:tripartite-type tricarboxylate transporter receptor subunit TctC
MASCSAARSGVFVETLMTRPSRAVHVPSRTRRRAVQAVALTLASGSLGARAQATAAAGDGFPNKPVRIVVTYAPGGLSDTLARVLADKMSKSMGVPVLVENRPGAAGIIGTDYVAKSPPDGYTISLALSNAIYTNQFIYSKLPYDPNKDIGFIYKLCDAYALMTVNPSVPARNLAEFTDWLKANSGKVNFGSYGIGSYPHLIGSYISKQQGVEMSHAVYKGEAPMVQDLLGGQLHFAFGSPAVLKPHFDAGKLRPIAVASTRRLTPLPDVPTFNEAGWKDKEYAIGGWFGLVGPAGMPKAVVDRLAAEARKALADPAIQARFVTFGYEAVTDSGPEVFAAEYKRNVGVWRDLVAISGVKAD